MARWARPPLRHRPHCANKGAGKNPANGQPTRGKQEHQGEENLFMSATIEATRYTNFVNGQESKGRDAATFESVNPTTAKLFGQFIESSAGDIDDAVKAAQAAFEGPWRALSPTRRGRLLMRWGVV